MVETLIASLIFSKIYLYIKLGKFQIHKESYLIKPILKRRSIYPVIFMSIFYIYLQYTIMNQNYYFLQYQHIIKNAILGSYMILGLDVLFRYEKYKEYIIACCSLLCGFTLNYIVMYFNNNLMPIFPSVSYSTGYTQYNMIMNASKYGDFHVLGDHMTNLIFLSDIFDVGGSILSPGDLLCRLFAFLIVYFCVKEISKIHMNKILNQ